jgi:hypothetical protein
MYFPDLEYLWSQPGITEGERDATRLNYYHELAHLLDFSLHRHAYRLKWFAIMHYRSPSRHQEQALMRDWTPKLWFLARGADGGPVIPDEQFAQAYDYCAEQMSYSLVLTTIRTTYWGFDYQPTAGEYRAACRMIHDL